jgi:hypothetical protein
MGERHEYRFYAGAIPSQHDDVMSSYLTLRSGFNPKRWLNREPIALQFRKSVLINDHGWPNAKAAGGRKYSAITKGKEATKERFP